MSSVISVAEFAPENQRTGDNERDIVYAGLLQAERQMARLGWDQQPVLWGMVTTTLGGSVALELTPLDTPVTSGIASPADILKHMTDHLEDPPPPVLVARRPLLGRIGLALVVETWGLRDGTKEEYADLDARKYRIEEMTDRRVETRMVFGADLNGQDYVLQRIRGEKKTYVIDPDVVDPRRGWAPGRAGGPLMIGIRRLAWELRTLNDEDGIAP